MTFKKAFLYAALIACIPLSLELWDRYKPVKRFEVVGDSLRGITRTQYNLARNQHNIADLSFIYSGKDTIWMQVDPITFTAHPYQFKCLCDTFNPVIEHSKIPKN